MNSKKMPFYETAIIFIGELITSIIICAVYAMIGKFSYKVITGAALGSLVTILNFFFLALSTNKVFDRAREARGTKEMSEEEIEEFTEKHQNEFNNMIKLSYVIRTVTMLLSLVVAFLLKWFDVIATLIPLLMLRPIIAIDALLRNKNNKE